MKRSVNPVPSDIKGMTVFNTDEVEDPAHPMGWHDDVPEGKSKLDNLLDELENANEEECESCAI